MEIWANHLATWLDLPTLAPFFYQLISFIAYVTVGLIVRQIVWFLPVIERNPSLVKLGRTIDLLILVKCLVNGLDDSSLLNPSTIRVPFFFFNLWVTNRVLIAIFHSSLVPETLTKSLRELMIHLGQAILVIAGIQRFCGIFLSNEGAYGDYVHLLIVIAIVVSGWDTIRNIWSGVALIWENSVCEGKTIHVDDVSGSVEKVGWRSTRIRTAAGTVVVPNTQIVKSRFKVL